MKDLVPQKRIAAELGVSQSSLWPASRSAIPGFPPPVVLRARVYGLRSDLPALRAAMVSYLINRLQPLAFRTPVVVTLNPAREPDPDKVIAEFDYAHPIFDGPAIAAQQRLASVQGENGIWLAGAWGSYGFHEDGLKSALRVVNGLGVMAPWQGAPALAPVAETA